MDQGGARRRARPLALKAGFAGFALLLFATWGPAQLEPLALRVPPEPSWPGAGAQDSGPLLGEVVASPATPYTGPLTAPELVEACLPARGLAAIPCYTERLKELQAARGAHAAFGLLAELSGLDREVDAQSHPMAHELGRHALEVYGSIQAAIANCSYKVFQGCLHGAFQAHFERNPPVGGADLAALCPQEDAFGQYACFHGVGHGVTIATHYAMNTSLGLCDTLPTRLAQGSCQGGVFMENVVAYIHSRSGVEHARGHEHHRYWVEPSNPQYPCDVVAEQHKTSCWLMQTSLILYLNGGDFRAAAQVCGMVPEPYNASCFESLGRDASSYAGRDPLKVVAYCATAPGEGRALCIRGYVAEVVLNYARPDVGLGVCRELPAQDKEPCYGSMAFQGRTMVSAEEMAAVCARAEAGYEAACRRGALLPAEA